MVRMGMFGRGLAVAGLAWLACNAFAADAGSPVGSSNVTTADPAVPRPPGQPCVVQLFQDDVFNDFGTRPFNYAPPAGCGTRWSKVVLEADFSVTAGRQYDRTGSIWLGGVNLYFGTTEEPSSKVAPSWHVERDLTDYSALFRNAGQGQAILWNLVNDTYTGVIHGSARLLFYPASALAPAAHAPDAVIALGSDAVGSPAELDHPDSQLAKTLTLPRNVERAYLDVIAQSQSGDEFWYTCVPDAYAGEVQECGGGNFREAEVSIDGQPAGVAPVYPWIYTGGIDPYLWRPVTGVQTLNFTPYRVDLSPFAGVLSDGAPHTVAVSVAGANNYFSAAASLLLYLDPHATQVTGRVTRNTLAGQAPTPTIGDTLKTDASGNVSGDITTKLSRQFVIEGYADTSHGRVRTTVRQTVGFADTQGFVIDAGTYRQATDQLTWADGTSERRVGGFVLGTDHQSVRYPLHLVYAQTVAADGSIAVATTVHQGYRQHGVRSLGGIPLYESRVDNTVDTADTLDFDAGGHLTAHTGQGSAQAFDFRDSLGSCYRATVQSKDGAVSGFSEGHGCPGGRNHVAWFARPDGSPTAGGSLLDW
ncbi:peptide-N(4)-(N-acetyl-beta-glucosaminyl)asparagine amidase [Fulvimonas sp. R45]|uniref:peptide-N4-asparagine amidase n=1 Tax=Fulvimonas sp. R45 TaxID=3045937 RepID=UPI00265E9EB9|nr:peptide-N4-asparagine amidase [Fulvimonas sp. R45]MDO1529393.1 peptide-N(4)-(N-acetyl-beta-glucosaminyl)asparagine amidase [Fulvimonas sp. R45]